MWRYILAILLFASVTLQAQDYNYLHFTTKDGIPSPTVYTIVQDTLGFMWIGTDNGLLRFDGFDYVYYTTAEGLPDNEVLHLWVDSKNRIWISCYNSPVCFLENGVINNKNNCEILRDAPKGMVYGSFLEDAKNQIWLTGETYTIKIDEHKTHVIDIPGRDGAPLTKLFEKDGVVYLLIETRIYDLNASPIKEVTYFTDNKLQSNYNKSTLHNDYIYLYSHNKTVWINRIKPPEIYDTNSRIEMTGGVSSIYKTGINEFVVCMDTGFIFTDSLLRPVSPLHLAGLNISGCYKDKFNNLWFTTFGDGIYLLPSNKCFSLDFSSEPNHGAVTVINALNDSTIVAGTEKGRILIIQNGKVAREITSALEGDGYKKIINLLPYKGDLLAAANNGIYQSTIQNKLKNSTSYSPVKTMSVAGDSLVFVGTSATAVYLDVERGIRDTIIKKRVIASHFDRRNTLWFATLDSLYKCHAKKYIPVGWYNLAHNGRVSSINSLSDNSLIVGTYNNGIVISTNDSETVLTTMQGLVSNICRYIYVDDNDHIWVCTTNGLSEIIFDIKTHSVSRINNYSQTDGLLSNSIYSVTVLDSIVYVGTDAGISFLQYGRYSTNENIPVVITQFNGRAGAPLSRLKFDYRQNDIHIEYSGISFHRLEPLFYTYRLIGSNDAWDTTWQKGINYSNLAPGKYTFEIFAHDNRGSRSAVPAIVNFEIVPAFWQTVFFKIIVGIIVLAGIYWLINFRSKSIRKGEIAKHAVEKQITELKLSAIRAQMNPHFIFNALNSIQHFNIVHDFDSAQKYLSEFSKLVRKTLDFSTQDFVLLTEEISYLHNYLSLEQMRFEGSFDFEISRSSGIPESAEVPSQVIQPYLENAILHGLQNMKNEKGHLNVQFRVEDMVLVCTIDDNGIGIDKGLTMQNKGHQSKGLNLSDARIQAINKLYKMNIRVELFDKSRRDKDRHGTSVTLYFPLKIQST